MDIFHVNEDLKSYTYPIVKLLICILLIVLAICRGQIIHTDSMAVEAIIGVLCTTVVIICIYCIYISVYEIFQTYENRSAISTISNFAITDSSTYMIDDVVNMVKANDIVEIQIIANNRINVIGSSSDCKVGSSKFFDKRYFIDENEFVSVQDFKDSLLSYSDNGKLSVILIDGIKPE